jgi:hypothetical protein
MKKILLILMLLPCLSFAQNKYIRPIVIFDAPIQKTMFGGASSHVGLLFGEEKFVQIGFLLGYRIVDTKQSASFSFMWKARFNKILIAPMFSYCSKEYQDISLRLGYSFNREKSSFIHVFGSTQMGYGIGGTFCLK